MVKSVSLDMEKVQSLAYSKYWTLAELARQSRLSNATIFSLKANRRRASMKTLLQIAHALQVDPADIIKN